MGKVTRKRHGAEFKAKVAPEAIKGEPTLALMRLIAEAVLDSPYHGSRPMARQRNRLGHQVGGNRARLKRKMDLRRSAKHVDGAVLMGGCDFDVLTTGSGAPVPEPAIR